MTHRKRNLILMVLVALFIPGLGIACIRAANDGGDGRAYGLRMPAPADLAAPTSSDSADVATALNFSDIPRCSHYKVLPENSVIIDSLMDAGWKELAVVALLLSTACFVLLWLTIIFKR